MSESALTYIKTASKLLKAHHQLALFPLLIGLLGSIMETLFSGSRGIFSSITMISAFAIMPAIYGRVNEIVTERSCTSWKYLFNKYFLKYVGIVISIWLITCIPYFFFSFLVIYIEAFRFSRIIFAFIILIYQLIGLYAVPILFYDNTIKQSLSLGFKCLVGNIQYNFPLIVILLVLTVFSIAYAQIDFELLNALFHYIRWCFLFVIKFILFITVTLILKDKIYCSQEL